MFALINFWRATRYGGFLCLHLLTCLKYSSNTHTRKNPHVSFSDLCSISRDFTIKNTSTKALLHYKYVDMFVLLECPGFQSHQASNNCWILMILLWFPKCDVFRSSSPAEAEKQRSVLIRAHGCCCCSSSCCSSFSGWFIFSRWWTISPLPLPERWKKKVANSRVSPMSRRSHWQWGSCNRRRAGSSSRRPGPLPAS